MLSLQDIEAEISYAYLHAVAAKAGVSCSASERHQDNAGIDATLHVVKDFGPGAALTEFSLHVQLKATKRQPALVDGTKFSYFMSGIDRYNKLRSVTLMPPRILVVLFLPERPEEWLTHDIDGLLLRRCAYWVSLYGAPESNNDTGETVYLPNTQHFSPDGLSDVLGRIARREVLNYAG